MRTKVRVMSFSVGVLLGAACLAGGAVTAAEAQEAIAAFDNEMEAWMEKARSAPAAERRELMEQRPDAGPAIGKALEFVKASAEDAAYPKVAGWLMSQRSSDVDRAAVYECLTKHHLDNPDLGQACLATLFDRGEGAQSFLESVYEKAGEAQAKAAAAYALSYKLRRAGDDQQEKRLEYLRAAVKGAGDLEFRGRNIKAAAEGQLFAAENLQIGKEAPDIEGEDTAGEAFKLSDYRGKVVVIDFWGDW